MFFFICNVNLRFNHHSFANWLVIIPNKLFKNKDQNEKVRNKRSLKKENSIVYFSVTEEVEIYSENEIEIIQDVTWYKIQQQDILCRDGCRMNYYFSQMIGNT